jgi:4-diphosphocytidyl-2-C-methyl-D-erythritol kinase
MLSVFAPAKINLSLSVGAPLPSGRHPLASLVAFASVGDTVRLAPADELTLTVEGPFAGALEGETDNLVIQAARALLRATDRRGRGAAITLHKALPVASGIGGGSADAAAALRGLSRLWDLDVDDATLMEVAGTLGADVPVCLGCRPALMTGTGETVENFPMPELDAVLVNPGTPVATADVYRRFDALGMGAALPGQVSAPDWRSSVEALRDLAGRTNDLTEAASLVAPEISEVIGRLRQEPLARVVRLSGSGGTVFALTEGAAVAAAIAHDLTAEQRGWWVQSVKLGAVDATPRPG